MKKSQKQLASLLATTFLLTGCLSNLEKEVNDQQALKPNQVAVQTTENSTASSDYRAVITNGRYALGASASVDSNLSSSRNAKAFEEGLLSISKAIFPPEQYFLKEGQLIDASTLTSWIARESELYPEGLNPSLPVSEVPESTESQSSESTESGESTSETTTQTNQVMLDSSSTPIYLAQIMEKDIMIETEEGYTLGGVVLGLAMNSHYSYTDANGVTHNQEISIGEIRERGKAYANIIVGRLRATEQLRSVPIVVGLFRQATDDETVGGTYIMDGISREGNSVTDWTEHNENRVSLPLINSTEAVDRYQYFYDFRSKIVDFFPNLNGIVGEAFYANGNLESLKIQITTQFYRQTEVIALTQHVLDTAYDLLPDGMEIEVSISSGVGMQAYVIREAGSTVYKSQVFK